MQLGMVGLGRMGANLVRRLERGGHSCVVYDVDADAVAAAVAGGALGAASLRELAAALEPPRAVWVMVPAAGAGEVIDRVGDALDAGDTVIDGGNSHFRDASPTAARLARRGVHFLDVGTSGGVHGLERGYCLMIGGDPHVVARLEPIFDTLAPGIASAVRTPGREGAPAAAEHGYLHCGPTGAGHFTKMVHNGIEYGLMAAYAEGLNLLASASADRADGHREAGTAPASGDVLPFELDVAAIAELWRRGSVIGSWLLDLAAASLVDDPHLEGFSGSVSDSGEGRWTVETAVALGVPVPVLATALFQRFASRGADDIANRIQSAMRAQFGGHSELPGTDVG